MIVYAEDSLELLLNQIREWRQEKKETVEISIQDLALMQYHIEDLELYEKRCEKLERYKKGEESE